MQNNRFIALVFCMVSSSVFADDFYKNLLEANKTNMLNEKNSELIPHYSESSKAAIEKKLNSIDEGGLENAGIKLRDEEIIKDPNSAFSIVDEASSIKRTAGFSNFHELEMFKRADDIMNDPVAAMNDLFNTNCKELTDEKEHGYHKREIKQEKTEEIEEIKSCQVPINKFDCQKTLSLTCESMANCEYGGVKPDSIDSDMKMDYANGILQIGKTESLDWSGNCKIYDKTTNFKLENIDQISEFKIKNIGFDDFLEVKINDHVVFRGPYGGNKLEVIEKDIKGKKFQYVSNGIGEFPCEGKQGHSLNTDIDLKPYLKEGMNTISTRVIVGGKGWMALTINSSTYCCASWRELWLSDCKQRN